MRCGSATGPGAPGMWAIALVGRANSGVERTVSICLLGRTSAVCAPPKSKKVCQPTKRRGDRKPPRRSPGSLVGFCPSGTSTRESKIRPKNGLPLSPARFARYDGRTMLCPNR